MEGKSRTEYSAKNAAVSTTSRIIMILMGFVTRVVFTHVLSEDYVGVNGLFTDIVEVLALSELGIGTAITFALYRPVADGDIERQKSLMAMLRTFYRIVAGIIMAAGLLLIPFMDLLVTDNEDVEHLTFIWLLYLINSAASYALIYKKSLIDAHQMLYIGVLYRTIAFVIQDVVQIVILITTHNFILYLCIHLVCTLGANIAVSYKADRLYPYLKEKDIKPLGKEEKSGLYRNMRATLMHKIGTVVVNNTDNILLSSMIGIDTVGIYSNYYLIIGSVRQVLDQFFDSITASVGNLGVKENEDDIQRVFSISFFVGQWIYGFAAICLFECLNPFVNLCFGKKYVFPEAIVLVLCIIFLINGLQKPALVFRDSLGLFRYDRYIALIQAALNLVISIVLALKLGTIGVFIGTVISALATTAWVEPYVLYRYRLQRSPGPYYLKYLLYCLVEAVCWFVTDFICRQYDGGLILTILFRIVVCIFIPNAIMLLAYGRTKEFKSVLGNVKKIIKNRR